MNPGQQHIRETLTEHGVEGFKKVPGNRAYAVDLETATALGSLAMAWRDQLAPGETFTREQFAKEVLEPLAKFEPSLVQDRPPDENEMPKLPVDPVTEEKIKNPWSKSSLDLESQALITQRDPALAEHLRATRDGTSFKFLAKLEDEKAQREKLRSLKYDEATHKGNPFHLGATREGVAPQSEFYKAHENEPHVIAFFKREAATKIKLPFMHPKNLTATMDIARSNPALHKIVSRAEEIHANWLKDDVARLEALTQQHSAQLARTKELAAAR